VAQHNAGLGAAYTRSRLPVELVYCERAANRSCALRREYVIRRLTRRDKEVLAKRWGLVELDQAE
jgi:putative endonuclease